MTGRQEYDRNMTGRQDDRQDDRQRILDEYMIDTYSHRERGRGELTREKVRGAIVHKADRKYQYD